MKAKDRVIKIQFSPSESKYSKLQFNKTNSAFETKTGINTKEDIIYYDDVIYYDGGDVNGYGYGEK